MTNSMYSTLYDCAVHLDVKRLERVENDGCFNGGEIQETDTGTPLTNDGANLQQNADYRLVKDDHGKDFKLFHHQLDDYGQTSVVSNITMYEVVYGKGDKMSAELQRQSRPVQSSCGIWWRYKGSSEVWKDTYEGGNGRKLELIDTICGIFEEALVPCPDQASRSWDEGSKKGGERIMSTKGDANESNECKIDTSFLDEISNSSEQ